MDPRKCTYLAVAAFVASTAFVFRQPKQIIAPPGTTIPNQPFSPGVRSGDLLYVAGTMATGSGGDIIPGDVEAQTKKTLENIGVILKAAGMDYKDVVSVNVFLSDAREFEGMNRAYREFFRTDPPVRATVEADLVLEEALVEISAIAARPDLPREVINPREWSTNPLPYSRAIRVGDHLFLAGLVSQDPRTGRPVAGDVKTQTRQILENAEVLVETAGFKMSDVTVSRVWLADARDFKAMNEAYRTYFGDVPPTRATVRSRLVSPVYKVEIMLSGVKGEKQRLGAAGQTLLSQAIKVGNRVFVSGIVRGDAHLRGDVRGQTRAVLQAIGDILKQGGMDFSDAVEAQVWIRDVRHFAAMNEVYREFISDNSPARATVGAGLMSADGLVEIAMTAAK